MSLSEEDRQKRLRAFYLNRFLGFSKGATSFPAASMFATSDTVTTRKAEKVTISRETIVEETATPATIGHPVYEAHEERLRTLEVQVARLAQEMSELRTAQEKLPIKVSLVNLRENVTVEQAESEILGYLRTHESAYPSDIADELGLDLELVIGAVAGLKCKGKIGSE